MVKRLVPVIGTVAVTTLGALAVSPSSSDAAGATVVPGSGERGPLGFQFTAVFTPSGAIHGHARINIEGDVTSGRVTCGSVDGGQAVFGGTTRDGVDFVLAVNDEPDRIIFGTGRPDCDTTGFGDPASLPLSSGEIRFVGSGRSSNGACGLLAQGIIDQSNEVTEGSSEACGAPPLPGASPLQGFTPERGGLSGVDLLLRAGGQFPAAGSDVEVRIKSSPPSWDVITNGSTHVAGPLAPGQQVIVHVRFPHPAPVHPGRLYFVEWVGGGPSSVLSWMKSTADPYPDGQLFQACTEGTPAPVRRRRGRCGLRHLRRSPASAVGSLGVCLSAAVSTKLLCLPLQPMRG